MEENVKKVRHVQLNKMGLERINEHRKMRGKKSIKDADVKIAPFGNEIVGVEEFGVSEMMGVQQVAASLPLSVDNSTSKFFPPIGSQRYNDCAQYSSIYYTFTYMNAMARNWDAKGGGNAVRFSPSWTYNMVNGGNDSGSWFAWELLQKHGCATMATFPYVSGDYKKWSTDAAVWRDALNYRADQVIAVEGLTAANNTTALEQVKMLLNNGYILNFATDIYGWVGKGAGNDPSTTADDSLAGKTIYYSTVNSPSGHAMTVVGYNDNIWCDINSNRVVDPGEKGALRICNSWGDWNEAGFTWVAYDALKTTTGVAGGPTHSAPIFWGGSVYGITARTSYTPRIVVKTTLNHRYREQIRITLGVSSTSATTPTTTFDMNCLQRQGGPNAFNGGSTAIDGAFCFDISDVAPASLTTPTRYYLKAQDGTSGNPLVIKSLSVVDVQGGGIETSNTQIPFTLDALTGYYYVDYVQTGPVGTHTLTATAGTGGAISPSGSIAVNSGTNKTFTITPNTGYSIANVKADGISVGNLPSYTFSNVTANHSLEATFAIKTYTLTASAGAGGSISPSGTIAVNSGTSKTYTITPNTGYYIANVKADGISVGNLSSYTFSNVTANHSLEATFAIKTYTLTATAGAGGAISPSGAIAVNSGTSKTYTITPNTGYSIADVKADGISVGNLASYMFRNVTANHTLTATFSKIVNSVPPVSGYARWFDASQLVGLSNGDPVTRWSDLSGNGADATVPSGNAAPVYVADAGTGTGLGAVYFAKNGGATNSAALMFPRDSAIRTVFSVFKGNSFLLTAANSYHFHRPTDWNPADPLWEATKGWSSPNIRNGATYVNGTLVNGTTLPMPLNSHNGFNLVEVLTVGNVQADSFNKDRTHHAGDQYQAEVIIYDRLLTESERLQVENYLINKWFTPTPVLPNPWQSLDVGAPSVAGSAVFSNPVYTLKGSGADIWSTSDQFQYVYQTGDADCSIVMRVSSMQNTNPWAKAGVMIRESLNPNARNVSVFVTPSNGVSCQWRTSTGGTSSYNQAVGPTAPYWVKLTRSGNTFTGYHSTDGTNWTLQQTQTVSMGTTVFIGMALTSHDNANLCTATIDNVLVVP